MSESLQVYNRPWFHVVGLLSRGQQSGTDVRVTAGLWLMSGRRTYFKAHIVYKHPQQVWVSFHFLSKGCVELHRLMTNKSFHWNPRRERHLKNIDQGTTSHRLYILAVYILKPPRPVCNSWEKIWLNLPRVKPEKHADLEYSFPWQKK